MSDSGLSVDIDGIGAFSAEGGIMGLIGPSGSGKTTLAEQIAGLRDGINGSIILSGTKILDTSENISIPAEKRSIGFMFQDQLLFPHMTIEKNILFPLNFVDDDDISLPTIFEKLNISPLLSKYPHQISGGEKQRVCFARALACQPKLLILDEPTAGLDKMNKINVLQTIKKMVSKAAYPVLLITHHMDDIIELCDSIAVMSDGKIIANGKVSDILAMPEVQPLLGSSEVITEIEGNVVLDGKGILKLEVGGTIFRLENDHHQSKKRRIRIRARDVALALKKPEDTSLQNIIPGTITHIAEHGAHDVLVTVTLGSDENASSIKSLITLRSKKALRLTTGLPIFVMIKAVAVQSPS